jgi:hypothetical protein
MKKSILFIFTLILSLGSISCNAQTNRKATTANPVSTNKVDVYYFHFTRRCMTCNAVEAESVKSIHALYPNQTKAGKITFKSVNLDEKSSSGLAQKLGISGQCLLIVSGKTKTDLTNEGFMYARSNPEKLKAELKKTIDPLIK